jgi:ABC-type Zn uptake system ZnuABC Zn-binding protein ZnuA
MNVEGSIRDSLSKLPPEIRARFHRNAQAYGMEQRAFEQWAKNGFSAGPPQREDGDTEGTSLE